MEKHISRILKQLVGSDDWQYTGEGYSDHPLYPYSIVTGEVSVNETVLPFRLPVRRDIVEREIVDDD